MGIFILHVKKLRVIKISVWLQVWSEWLPGSKLFDILCPSGLIVPQYCCSPDRVRMAYNSDSPGLNTSICEGLCVSTRLPSNPPAPEPATLFILFECHALYIWAKMKLGLSPGDLALNILWSVTTAPI